MFLIILAESNIDLELLIYKNFGTVPGLSNQKNFKSRFSETIIKELKILELGPCKHH